MSSVEVSKKGNITLVTINRPEVRNAVDQPTAEALRQAFTEFDNDPESSVAILYGANNHFCAGADLKAIANGDAQRMNRIESGAIGPMGPTRMLLKKPVIAAVSGACVAGGLELALWCDMRMASEDAIFGVFCRRWGVPLIDGGTVRLPRLIGMSRALDMILTGRPVDAREALQMGLVNRVVPADELLASAEQLASQIAAFPQTCLQHDRMSVYEQIDMGIDAALLNEHEHGLQTLASGETVKGASRFRDGAGRHGSFDSTADDKR